MALIKIQILGSLSLLLIITVIIVAGRRGGINVRDYE